MSGSPHGSISRRSDINVNFEGSRVHPFQRDPYSPAAIDRSYGCLAERIDGLIGQLDTLISECRQLGRSYALSDASRGLRAALEDLKSLFFNNAQYLKEVPGTYPVHLPSSPQRFYQLARGCEGFEEELNEFTDTPEGIKIKEHLDSFAKDMMYRGSSLAGLAPIPADFFEPMDPLEVKNISYYLHDLSGEMENDFLDMTTAFKQFNTHGIPSLQFEEKRETDVLISVSTVGSLLSAVTATALQVSLGFDEQKGPLISIVNSFWFSSLVLSIGAALNSVLSVIWKRTPHGSRGRRLPLSMTVWINASAPTFLAISIGCFLAGLVIFTFASAQQTHTKYITIASTGITSLGAFLIMAWFGYEKWVSKVLSDVMGDEKGVSGKILHQQRSWANTNSIVSAASSRMPFIFPSTPPTHIRPHSTVRDLPNTDIEAQEKDKPVPRLVKTVRLMNILRKAFRPDSRRAEGMLGIHQALESSPSYIPPSLMVFPERSGQSISSGGKIQDIEYSPDGAYVATTSYLQSKNGNTVSSIITIYSANADYTKVRSITRLNHKVKSISWSPSSNKLLLRFESRVEIIGITEDLDSPTRLQHRPLSGVIQSAVWSDSNSVLLVGSGSILDMDVQGQLLKRHEFPTLLLRDVAVVPGTRLLLVTGRIHSTNELLPNKSRGEKRLILYNRTNGEHVRQIPFLDDIRYVRISRTTGVGRGNSFDILLSLKDRPSSMLWTLKLPFGERPKLEPYHTQHVDTSQGVGAPELAGHAYFVGDQDQLIACRSSDGNLYLWDRHTGAPVRTIRAKATNHGVRSLAWRPSKATPLVTFVSVHNEKFNVWKAERLTQPTQPTQPLHAAYPTQPAAVQPTDTIKLEHPKASRSRAPSVTQPPAELKQATRSTIQPSSGTEQERSKAPRSRASSVTQPAQAAQLTQSVLQAGSSVEPERPRPSRNRAASITNSNNSNTTPAVNSIVVEPPPPAHTK